MTCCGSSTRRWTGATRSTGWGTRLAQYRCCDVGKTSVKNPSTSHPSSPSVREHDRQGDMLMTESYSNNYRSTMWRAKLANARLVKTEDANVFSIDFFPLWRGGALT